MIEDGALVPHTFGDVGSMSALPPKADIKHSGSHVRLVPQAAVEQSQQNSITILSAKASQPGREAAQKHG